MTHDEYVPTDALTSLQRWESFGAQWRVLETGPGGVTISLCRCDSDEEVDRIVSADTDLIDYLDGRQSSS